MRYLWPSFKESTIKGISTQYDLDIKRRKTKQ